LTSAALAAFGAVAWLLYAAPLSDVKPSTAMISAVIDSATGIFFLMLPLLDFYNRRGGAALFFQS
jgi:hypothetical protein